MFEEPTRLATYLIQHDRPITELLHSDATLVNKRLAQHYGLPFRGPGGPSGRRPRGLHEQGRGGVLGMAVFLTKNSQPQRTSPVKRGFWVVHKLLGEHIPPPPADVAVLPAKETDTNGKTHPPAAGAAHRGRELRPLPSALRLRRPVDGRLRPDRQEPDQGPGGPADR